MKHVRCLILGLRMSLILITILVWSVPSAGAAAGIVVPYTICFPYAPKQASGASATLIMTATSSTATRFTVTYWRANGTSEVTQDYTLAPRATQVINLNDVAVLPDGEYQVEVTSNFALAGVAHVRETSGAVGVYLATECEQASAEAFGFFYTDSPDAPASTLHLMNSSDTAAAVSLTLAEAGYSTNELTIPAHGSIRFSTADVPESKAFPQGYGLVTVNSMAPGIHGVLANESKGATTYASALWLKTTQETAESTEQMASAISRAFLPRIAREVAEGSMSFSTKLLVAGPNARAATIVMNLYRPDGSQAGTPIMDQISGGSAKMYWPLYNIDPQTSASLVVGSNQNIVLEAEFVPNSSVAAGGTAYSVDSIVLVPYTSTLVLPGVVHGADTFSLISAQNTGSSTAPVRIDLVDAQGATVHSTERQVSPGASMTVDVRDAAMLPSAFTGSAIVSSSGPVAGQLDVYAVTVSGERMYLPIIEQ